jgi:hypothetical protein
MLNSDYSLDFFDSHPSSANAVIVGENAVEAASCGPPCRNVIRGRIVLRVSG